MYFNTWSSLDTAVRQDKTQAAENNSPPPVSASWLKAGALEVSYTMGVQDWVYAYRLGISHLRRFSFGLLSGQLIAVACLLVAALVSYDGYVHAWHRQHTFPWHYVHIIMLAFCVGPVSFILLMTTMLWSAASRSLILQDAGIIIRPKGGRSVVRWSHVSDILKQGEYIAICSGSFDALIIPRRAFPDEQAAERFYTAALNYWREAKGLPPTSAPDMSGVWPPAPRPGNSAEPGDSP